MIVRISKYCFMVAVAMMLSAQLFADDRTNYEFQAQYDKVFDGIDNPYPGANFKITVSRLSGDGRILAFAGWVENPGTSEVERYIVIMNFDGTLVKWIDSPVNPDDGKQIKVMDIAMSHYGANIYFISEYSQNRIYRIQDGEPREILNTVDYWDTVDGHFKLIAGNEILRTTYDGDFVYFLEGKVFGFDDKDIWRIDGTGLKAPELIVDDKLVQTNDGPGRMVQDFDVSHSGYYITFILYGYSDGGTRTKNEIFTMAGDVSNVNQLTDDNDVDKFLIRLSDDHSTMVFVNGYPVNEWVGMDFDGTNRHVIAPLGYNISGPAITMNGDTVFYYDHKAEGGRIAASNGRGHYPLFPGSTINLAATYDPEISADSSRVSFRDSQYTLYAGELNLPLAASNAPDIENILLDPPFIDMYDAEGKVLLTTRITDPQDDSEIERTSLDHLLEGDFVTSLSELPIWFPYPPKDNGDDPDDEADDNNFTAISRTTNYDPGITYFTLRVGAQDTDGNVAIADTILGTPDSSCSSDNPVDISPVVESGEPMFCVGALHVQIQDIVVSNLSHLGVLGQSIGLTLGGTISVSKGSTMTLSVR